MLTETFAAPPVVAVTAGQMASDLTACILPEINKSAIKAKTVLTFIIVPALAAKTIAPAVGRIKLCTISLT